MGSAVRRRYRGHLVPQRRRRGIATRLVEAAVSTAREQRVQWLHVDYEPQLQSFYEGCGFRPTSGGLISLGL